MKRTWNNAELVELSIVSTENQPTTEMKSDDVITGVGLKQGVYASGVTDKPEYPIPYYPNK